MIVNLNIKYERLNSIHELNQADQDLLNVAINATTLAQAKYSNFKVGAAAKLDNNAIVIGFNHENASHPVTVCAEIALLSNILINHPNNKVVTLALSYNNINGQSKTPISPCGHCRQALMEYEQQLSLEIRCILGSLNGEVIVINGVSNLLPLAFSNAIMTNN
jgi:cytidine deaminase